MSTVVNVGDQPTEHLLSDHEIATLNKPRRDWKWWAGMIGSVVGMGFIVLYCILPFYWMVVSSLRLRLVKTTDGPGWIGSRGRGRATMPAHRHRRRCSCRGRRDRRRCRTG